MTATATQLDNVKPEGEALVAVPEKQVLFISRRSGLRLVKTPIYPQFGVSGQKVGETRGKTVRFDNACQLRVPLTGDVTLEKGERIDAGELVEWLENHRLNGSRDEGFWRVDLAAPAPTRVELETMMTAAINFDEDLLERMIAEEERGWAREDVLDTARDALGKIRKIREQAQAQATAEAAEAAKKTQGGAK